jgi:hypothetical protein
MPHSRAHTRVALAACATAVAVALAGCNSDHSTGSSSPTGASTAACQPAASARCGKVSAPAAGVITRQEAAAQLARYITINNEANKKVSAKLNDQIETGALRAQSQAQFKMYPYWDAASRSSEFAPFTYLDPTYYIPRSAPKGQDPWFAVLTRGQQLGKKKPTTWTSLLIFTEASPGAWRISAETPIDQGQHLPQIAVDADGFAKTLDPDTAGLAIRPSQLPIAVTDNFVTGGKADGAVFATTPDLTSQRKAHQDHLTMLRPHGRSEFMPANNLTPEVYALATSGGGALVVASSAHAQHDYTLPGYSLTLDPHNGARAWLKSSALTTAYIQVTCLDTASVPRTGKVALLGSDCETTGAY